MSYEGNDFVLTANHCITHLSMDVTTINGETYEGRLAYADDARDIAILDVDIDDIRPIKFKVPRHIGMDDKVSYFGHTLGFKWVYFKGNISGSKDDMIVYDLEGWRGCSGAAIINNRGETLGVVSGLLLYDYEGMEDAYNGIVISPRLRRDVYDDLKFEGWP